MWLVSYVVLWVLVALLVLFSLVAARQFGLVHSELASMGSSSTTGTRADVGAIFPSIEGLDLEGHHVLLREPDAERTLIVVVSPECALCDATSPLVRDVHQKWADLDVIVASATEDFDATRDFVRRNNLDDVTCVLAPSLPSKVLISETPCAILVNHDGRIVGKAALGAIANIRELEYAFGRGRSDGDVIGRATPRPLHGKG